MNFTYYLHDEASLELFEQTVLWFKSRYKIVSIQEIREHIYEGRSLQNSCMLSVDDGWRSTYDVIFPVMKKYNLPFTIFVSPHVMETGMNFWYYTIKFCNQEELKDMIIKRGLFTEKVRKYPCELIFKEMKIDEVYDVLNEYLKKHPEISIPRGFMNTQEVLEMQKSGLVEIGAHTMVHPILKAESADRSNSEIADSVTKLSSILDRQVKSFAYPNGTRSIDYTHREELFVKSAGVDMAFSVDPREITPKTNPLSIPRWGSVDRLKFGKLGAFLPSRANQMGIRSQILRCKL